MSRTDRIVVAAGGAALILAVAAAWVLVAPSAAEEPPSGAALLLPSPGAASVPATAGAGASLPAEIFVDVQGGVARPGVRQLAAGSRVADAIAAAGGYAADADLDAATASINLARPLTDGEQVRVPRIGDAVAGAAPGGEAPVSGGGGSSGPGGTDGSAGGLVNLNTASPEELEALPGIGPVTVQKIVAARQEQPFASLEDAVQRGVINRGQLEDIQGLATAG